MVGYLAHNDVRCRRTAVYFPTCSDGSGTALSGRPYFSKQRSQYPVSGCLEQRKCTRVLQASQSLKSLSRVPAISIMNCSPSLDSDSWTVKPPATGLLHTEQTSFEESSMVLRKIPSACNRQFQDGTLTDLGGRSRMRRFGALLRGATRTKKNKRAAGRRCLLCWLQRGKSLSCQRSLNPRVIFSAASVLARRVRTGKAALRLDRKPQRDSAFFTVRQGFDSTRLS